MKRLRKMWNKWNTRMDMKGNETNRQEIGVKRNETGWNEMTDWDEMTSNKWPKWGEMRWNGMKGNDMREMNGMNWNEWDGTWWNQYRTYVRLKARHGMNEMIWSKWRECSKLNDMTRKTWHETKWNAWMKWHGWNKSNELKWTKWTEYKKRNDMKQQKSENCPDVKWHEWSYNMKQNERKRNEMTWNHWMNTRTREWMPACLTGWNLSYFFTGLRPFVSRRFLANCALATLSWTCFARDCSEKHIFEQNRALARVSCIFSGSFSRSKRNRGTTNPPLATPGALYSSSNSIWDWILYHWCWCFVITYGST